MGVYEIKSKKVLFFYENPILQVYNIYYQLVYTYMLGRIVLIFEVIIIILYGVFLRTDSTSTSSISQLDSALFFIIAYTYLSSRQRALDWTVISNYLFIAVIAFQLNTLYYFLWVQAFANTFSSTSSITSAALISGVEATLTVIITTTLFITKLSQLQIFIIVFIEVLSFAVNWGICRWGINMITGGGGATIWLYGLIFAALIKKLKFPEEMDIKNARYFTKILQIIALAVVFVTWPSLNTLMSELDSTVQNLSTDALLTQEAYIQTWLCLFSCIATTLSLRIMGQKMLLQKVASSIINTGILISSSASVIIDPFASLLFGMIGPIICFLYDRYAEQLKALGYPFDSILMGILSGVFSSIFCGGRNGRTPSLSSDPVKQGGLQFAGFLVSVLFAIVFGLITGLILRCTGSENLEQTDMTIWHIEPEILPLYQDDPKLDKLYKQEDKERMQNELVNFSLKQRYDSTHIRQINPGQSRRKAIRNQINYESRISGGRQ